MAHYAWAVWLAVPVTATVLAAVWTWWRGRDRKTPGPRQTIAAHRAYLDALAQPALEAPAERTRTEPRRSPSVTAEARSTVTR